MLRSEHAKLQAAFTPSDEKIEKAWLCTAGHFCEAPLSRAFQVMQFFVMAAEDKNISLDNFLKGDASTPCGYSRFFSLTGMTLLFGDLTHLAASPIARMSPTVSPAIGAQVTKFAFCQS